MLKHLKDKKDVGFFTSVAGLMQQCRYVKHFKQVFHSLDYLNFGVSESMFY